MRHWGRRRASRLVGAAALCAAVLAVPARAETGGTDDTAGESLLGSLFRLRTEDSLPPIPTRNNYGMTGLIDLPSAEMQPDGEFGITSSFFGGFLRNTIAMQIFEGVEVAFRYSTIGDFTTGPVVGGTLFDRSFDLKARLIRERRWWPSVAIGLQDFLGTGVYSAEYIVATRHFGPDFVVTGGIGWGRLAGRGSFYNPFRVFSSRFDTRAAFSGQGGTPNFGRYFQGANASPFFGAEWHTPVEDLTFKAEFSPDRYSAERVVGPFDPRTGINFGLDWRPVAGLELGAYFMHGAEFGIRVTFTGNPDRPIFDADTEPAARAVLERAPPPGPDPALFGAVVDLFTPATATLSFPATGASILRVEEHGPEARFAIAELPISADDRCPLESATAIDAELGVIDAVVFQWADGTVLCTVALRPRGAAQIFAETDPTGRYPVDWHADVDARARVTEALDAELAGDGILLQGIDLRPNSVEIYIENQRYRATPRALGRAARALTRTMPASVETFVVTPIEGGLPVVSVVLRRRNIELQIEAPDAARRSFLTADIHDALPRGARGIEPLPGTYPRYSYAIVPQLPVNAFDPDQPIRVDLGLAVSGSVEFLPGLSLNGTIHKRIVGQLDDITRPSDSLLPHVRSDFARYFREGDPGLDRLSIDYLTKLDDDIYARFSAGLLEQMHGGVSAEVLWKPVDQSWGLGAEINWTAQRDFDMLFGFQAYDVITGHASLYWDTGFHDIQAQIDAGRYLAGDYGATLSLSRRFANGWEIGAFFTLTDVPFDRFGEGSFDRGITLTIPLNWLLPNESKDTVSTVIRPLTRDGGQRLEIDNRLYPIVRNHHLGGLRTDWDLIWQ